MLALVVMMATVIAANLFAKKDCGQPCKEESRTAAVGRRRLAPPVSLTTGPAPAGVLGFTGMVTGSSTNPPWSWKGQARRLGFSAFFSNGETHTRPKARTQPTRAPAVVLYSSQRGAEVEISGATAAACGGPAVSYSVWRWPRAAQLLEAGSEV